MEGTLFAVRAGASGMAGFFGLPRRSEKVVGSAWGDGGKERRERISWRGCRRRNRPESPVENKGEEVKESGRGFKASGSILRRGINWNGNWRLPLWRREDGRSCFVLSSMKETCSRGELIGGEVPGSGPGQRHITSNNQILTWFSRFPCLGLCFPFPQRGAWKVGSIPVIAVFSSFPASV